MFLHLHIDFIYNATVHKSLQIQIIVKFDYLTRISCLYVFNMILVVLFW